MRTRYFTLWLVLILMPASVLAEKPANWFLAGSAPSSYTMEQDLAVTHEGRASGRLASIDQPAGFGTMMQSFDPGSYRGKRLKLSAFVKAKDVANWAGLWMRVDGPDSRRSLAFDNMQGRPITGTSDWTRYDVVLDIAESATSIAFGVLVDGTGTVWMDEVAFQVVNTSVPVTSSPMQQSKPENLNFEN